MNAIELSLFANRLAAVCDEMGAILQRAAFSPNIRDRLDFSCAVFDAKGRLCAQAAHIPVHLGSMAYAMQGIVSQFDWQADDMVIVNDPYLGGTHLPDVTFISPVISEGIVVAFVANRAHHADIGADSPGSMPISSCLDEEGLIIPPSYICKQGQLQDVMMQTLLAATRSEQTVKGDVAAQMSANRTGSSRLRELIQSMSIVLFTDALDELNDYGERLAKPVYKQIPDGEYRFTDYMDDDGQGQQKIPISACIKIDGSNISVDFTGTSPQVSGNINCPLSVAAAAVYYVFRCLLPDFTPACAGTFRAISLLAPESCLVNATRPAAVAAGNVETSTRIVDVIIGALLQAIPEQLAAASHGSMNNVAMGFVGDANTETGQHAWDYYETIGGGMGASAKAAGLSGVQTHMTNTLNTPVEVLELNYPLRVKQYAIRKNSGGEGVQRGGDGIIREYEFLYDANVTLLTERRYQAPWGVNGGEDAKVGVNSLNGKKLGAKINIEVAKGDCLKIETPGGGGWGGLI